jgi:hypothetical protein
MSIYDECRDDSIGYLACFIVICITIWVLFMTMEMMS